MRNKNAQPIQRLALLLLFACTLTGCVLTRVSDSAHAKEVDSLNVVGLSLDNGALSLASHWRKTSLDVSSIFLPLSFIFI